MGQVWCKNKNWKEQDTNKSPLDRVFLRCAQRVSINYTNYNCYHHHNINNNKNNDNCYYHKVYLIF